jgi:hypothetical protein
MVQNPEVMLCRGKALLSRLAPPKGRLRVVLRHTLAVAVQHAKLELRRGEALLAGLTIPRCCLRIVLWYTMAVVVQISEAVLRPSIASLRVLRDSASSLDQYLPQPDAPRPTIRSEFVRWLATDPEAATYIDPKGLRAYGITLPGRLDL